MSRKGYFFTADGLIALALLVIGFLLIYAAFVIQPPELQPELFAYDLIDFLDKTKINEFDREHNRYSAIFEIAGIDESNTVLEQAAAFCYDGRTTGARRVIDAATGDGKIIREQYNYEILIKSWEYGSDAFDTCLEVRRGTRNVRQTEVLVTAKDVIFFRSGDDIIGPWLAEVNIWR